MYRYEDDLCILKVILTLFYRRRDFTVLTMSRGASRGLEASGDTVQHHWVLSLRVAAVRTFSRSAPSCIINASDDGRKMRRWALSTVRLDVSQVRAHIPPSASKSNYHARSIAFKQIALASIVASPRRSHTLY